jgi:hypothetical protein
MRTTQHCGQYDHETVMAALAKTRITHENQLLVIRFLVEGVRIKGLGVTKQRAHTRIKQVLEVMGK